MIEITIEDKKASFLREDYDLLENSALNENILRLLPSFDPYMLGHVEKHHLVDFSYYKRVYRNAGWVSPVVLLSGRVIATWSYTRRGERLSLEIEPFRKLSKDIRTKVEEEAASLGEFLEASWDIKFCE